MAEDPVRLFDESGSALLKSLLSAARDEAPNHAALQRTLTAVGVGSALIATAGTASAAAAGSVVAAQGVAGAASLGGAKGVASATLLVVIKWLGAGAIAGILATSAIYAVTESALPPPSAAPVPVGKATAPAIVKARSGAAVPALEAPEQIAEPTASAAPAAPSAAPVASVIASAPQPISVSAEVDPAAPLAAELALLDSARQALAAGNSARALRALNDYDVRFEHPNLAPEALYLRLEALTLQGDKAGTQAVARRLLRSYPNGPHAARARSVLGLDQ
ncbi:MAG: hypothetical protein ABUL62_09165 [Myxococcales bacterium]|jgi:hypothetical protein